MKNMSGFLVTLALAAVACGPPDDHDDGGTTGGGGSHVTCGTLDLNASDGLDSASFWPVGDTYGVNAFYVWKSTGLAEASLPAKDWQIPTTLWSAVRFNLDGLDPYHFSATDSFRLWYLPYVASSVSWQSKTGARNDGTCPGSDTLTNGRHSCDGRRQLDRNAPSLVKGETYLFRMLMIVPLGTDSSGRKLNRAQSCYQTTATY